MDEINRREQSEHKQEPDTHGRAWSMSSKPESGWPMAFVGSESSFRFSSHSWSCFFTLFMSDSCEVEPREQRCTFSSVKCSLENNGPCCISGLQHSQSRRESRPREAMESGWHSETSSVNRNESTRSSVFNLTLLVLVWSEAYTFVCSQRSVWPAGSTNAGPVYSSELWVWRRGTCGALKVASAAQQRAGLEGSVRAGSALWPVWFWETQKEGDESQHKHVMSGVNVRKCMTGSM